MNSADLAQTNLLFEECERTLFSLSHLTATTTVESSENDLDLLLQALKFLRISCAKGKEVQEYIRSENLHLLVDGYIGWFWDKNPVIFEECLKFYCNFCAGNASNSLEVAQRFFCKGDLGYRILNGSESSAIFMLNCFKSGKEVINSLSPDRIDAIMKILLITWNGCPIHLEVFKVFLDHLQWERVFQDWNDDQLLGQLLDILVISASEDTLVYVAEGAFKELKGKPQDGNRTKILLEFISHMNIPWPKVKFESKFLKDILLLSFEKDYDPTLQFQSNILMAIANIVGACPKVANDIIELEILPLILLCTPISNLDSLRREKAIFLIKILSLHHPDVGKILTEICNKSEIQFSI